MTNQSLEIQPPQAFAEYAAQIELRIAALEQELAQMKAGMPQKQPWWVEMSGSGADNPLFEDAVRYGQEWRNSAE
jgi:hypothetical protein